MNNIILECKNLYKSYQEGNTKTSVLQNINFTISKGEMIAITGSSGSGKSTLLNLLGGLDTPNSGDVFFCNKSISKMSPDAKADLRNRKIGFIYQFHHLLPDFTVLENVAMPLLINKRKINEIISKVNNLLKLVDLSYRNNYYPSELSGGERQRTAIARALINNPYLVLADEPTGNLDTYNTNKVFNLLVKLNAIQGTSFIIVTHDLKLAKRMNRQLEIKDGQIIS